MKYNEFITGNIRLSIAYRVYWNKFQDFSMNNPQFTMTCLMQVLMLLALNMQGVNESDAIRSNNGSCPVLEVGTKWC